MHGEHHHVCTKCGWSFPNSHPSAKHRRAHKKVCGKLEGFKLLEPQNSTNHLTVSDDDDEDHNKEGTSNSNVKGVMGRQISNRSVEEEFSDANTEFFYTGAGQGNVDARISGTASSVGMALEGLIQPSNYPTDGNQLQSSQAPENVEDQMKADTHQDHASRSTMHSEMGSHSDQIAESLTAEMIDSTNGSKPEAAEKENPGNAQNGGNSGDSRQVEDTNRESNIDGSKSTMEALATKTTIDSPGDTLMSEARPVEEVLDKTETVASGLKDSLDKISPGSEEGCSINESLLAVSDHSSVDVNKPSETIATGFKEQELVNREPNLISDSSKAINGTEVHLKNSEQTHLEFWVSKTGGTADISPSAGEILDDNLQQEEMGSKIIVEAQADTSAAKDRTSEKFESNGAETFLDTRTSFSHLLLLELDCSQQEKPHEILPITNLVVRADGDANTISPPDSFCEETDEVKVNVVTEESKIEKSEIANIGETIEENSTKTKCTSDNKTELSGMGINEYHLENIAESLSNAQVCRDESFQQSSDDLEIITNADLPSFIKTEVDTVDTNSKIADPVHEETKLNHSNEVGINQSGAENPIINDFMPCAVDAESFIPSPVKVNENKGKDYPEDASDVQFQSLQEKSENNILEHKSDASSSMPPDWSVDSISQTDTVEGNWGSVSDGAGPSVDPNNVPPILAAEVLPGTDTPAPKEATQTATLEKMLDTSGEQNFGNNDDVPPILAAEVLPGTDTPVPKEATEAAALEKTLDASEEQKFGNNDGSDAPSFMTLIEPGKGEDQQQSASEIGTAQDPQQPNSSSLQAEWVSSHVHTINESERKKNEDIIEKVTKWNSDKEHTPLRNLLVEANSETNHKVKSTQSHNQETDTSTSTQDAVHQGKTVDPPVAAPEATTTHTEKDAEKEWNSPARLPISREKRKVRYWAPFMCCSSVN